MTWRFIGVQQIEEIQTRLIENYGGSHGLRDAGLLESPVVRAENRVAYDDDATVGSVGASLAWGLIKNHAFIDGNKRIGAAALFLFLAANAHRLKCSEEEETSMVLRAAASEITEAEFAAWVEQSVEPL